VAEATSYKPEDEVCGLWRPCLVIMIFLMLVQHRTVEAVLDRGEKLDDLVGKSEELSLHSKAFYTTVCI